MSWNLWSLLLSTFVQAPTEYVKYYILHMSLNAKIKNFVIYYPRELKTRCILNFNPTHYKNNLMCSLEIERNNRIIDT